MAKKKTKQYEILTLKKGQSLQTIKTKLDLSYLPDMLFLKNTEHDYISILIEKDTSLYAGHVYVDFIQEDRTVSNQIESVPVAKYTFVNVLADVSMQAIEKVFVLTEASLKTNKSFLWQKIVKENAPEVAIQAAKHFLFEDNGYYLEGEETDFTTLAVRLVKMGYSRSFEVETVPFRNRLR